jgi:hypothetical protein
MFDPASADAASADPLDPLDGPGEKPQFTESQTIQARRRL